MYYCWLQLCVLKNFVMNCWTLTQFISFNAFYKKVNCFNNKFSPDCTICYKLQSWGLLCCQFSGFVVVFLVKSLILNPNLNGFVMQRLLTLGRYCYMFFLRYSWYTVNVLDVLSILQLVYYKYFCDFFFLTLFSLYVYTLSFGIIILPCILAI